ncbi:hypothetical protein DMC25_19000 [Caulobacter sp. D4A]|nr:hypothetical protein DMC25_19000 [Caulobacter sp. D4A]PXA86665.1 hypothetical protein DMC18_21710 [Caulobacter sp. D5]
MNRQPRPESLSFDVVRVFLSDAVDDRLELAELRRALLPASLDVFDLHEGRDWIGADDFLRSSDAAGFPTEGRGPRVVVPADRQDLLDAVLARRGQTGGVFLGGLGPWRAFFGSDRCMQLTKRWALMDDPTFRLEPMATFANFAAVGQVDRTWVEWQLLDRATAERPSSVDDVLATDLARGLPIEKERVAAYLTVLKRMLGG